MSAASRSNSGPQTDSAVARYEKHRRAVDAIRDDFARLPSGAAPRIAKRTSNLFRFRTGKPAAKLDVAAFDEVLQVDPQARTADVQGMVTYERLVDATLPYGLMPLVVPQLRTITLGGAVTGLGIESSSFHSGLPHESVLEMEILTGSGEVVVATPDNEHADLFLAFPNSYGTLGYALRLTIELQPVKPYVKLRHLRFDDAAAAMTALDQVCAARTHEGELVDFVDGAVFSAGELYLTLGEFVDEAPATSDYTGMDIYYRSIQRRDIDYLTVYDYLWRWDTDWFWCSGAFGVQRPGIRRFWPRRYRRSDVYRKLVALDRRYQVTARLDRLRGRPRQEAVIQDIEVPINRVAEFLEFFHRDIGISPVWLCPLRLRKQPGTGVPRSWPLYPLNPEIRYVNVGFWSTVALPPGREDGYHNRLIEDEVTRLDGHKSLYSTAFYPPEEFWRLYNGPLYRKVKDAYDPGGRLLDLYDKCVKNR